VRFYGAGAPHTAFKNVAGAWMKKTRNRVDPMSRNLIFVEGSASLTGPVDEFEIQFGFDLEKATFQKGERGFGTELGLTDVEVIRGWSILKQAKISFKSNERQISNRVIIKVHSFPAGKLQRLVADIIDGSLGVDNAVILEHIRVSLSGTVERIKKKEVVESALKNLKTNAEGAAATLGASIITPKRVYISQQAVAVTGKQAESHYGLDAGSWEGASISYNKGFQVNTDISDRITLTATVAGTFQIETE